MIIKDGANGIELRALVVVPLILGVCLAGCATTNRTKTLIGMAAGALAGTAVGYATAPEGTSPTMHSAYWGLAGGTAMAVTGLFVFDEQKRSEELERKLNVAQMELGVLKGEASGGESEPLYETRAPFGKTVPKEYQALVTPGTWSVYHVNQWIQKGEGTLIHQDRMMKLTPPKFSPNQPGELSSSSSTFESAADAAPRKEAESKKSNAALSQEVKDIGT